MFAFGFAVCACVGGDDRAATTELPETIAPTTVEGTVPETAAPSTEPQEATGDHQTALSVGESPFLGVYLVPVDGYTYMDADDSEIDATVAVLDSVESDAGYDLFGAVSLHSVVADDPSQNTARNAQGGTEVGYLALVQFTEVIPAGFDEQAASNSAGSAPIDQLDISGIPVFVFEDPASLDSRYTYVWFEHGNQAFIDGADREPLERWITAYLDVPKLSPGETESLDALLGPLEGFAYANFDPTIQPEINEALGQYAYSAHRVADTEDAIGTLLLVESSDATPFEGLMATLGFTKTATDDYDGIAIDFWESTDNPDFGLMEWNQSDQVRAALAYNNADVDPASEFVVEFWLANS